MAVMLVVTTLLTWYFTSTYGARSVKSLANVLRQQLLRASMQAMVSILGEVYNGTVVLSSLHQQAFYATQNATWDNVEPRVRSLFVLRTRFFLFLCERHFLNSTFYTMQLIINNPSGG